MASTKGKLIKMYSEPQLSRPALAVKMVAARCPLRDTMDSHQPRTESSGYWVEECKAAGHDPFSVTKEILLKRDIIEERDGRRFKTGEEEEVEVVTYPNLEQVANEIKAVSGRGVAYALESGWVFPDELGYAPFCDYLNCWNQNPKFRTNVGTYCNREQAAIMVLVTGNDLKSDTGTPVYLSFGEDEPNFKRQLDAVAIDSPHRQ